MRTKNTASLAENNMSLPTAVFLDTSVLAGQQYNFASTALASFVPMAARHSLDLLLPDPTEREIQRQINERSREALEALEAARRHAPFLAKWKHFPEKVSGAFADWEVRRIALNEWSAFLSQFKVQKLGYDGLDVTEVMGWYDKVTPPFREGKKRKEFPDAFAIAILAAHATKKKAVIAVVSEDTDFKLACDRYSSLLYFKSLPALTELLLTDPQHIEQIRTTVLKDAAALDESISQAVSDLVVVHTDTDYDVDETKVAGVSISELRVVAIGSRECTLTFEGGAELENHLIWREWDPDREEDLYGKKWVIETVPVSGTLKVSIDPEKHQITDVVFTTLDQEFLEVSENPRR